MEFIKISKSNYMECINLKVSADQVDFVSDNSQSLVESVFEEGLNTLGIYNEDTMIGFILYDYDSSFPGWSLSRFMIDYRCQGKGYGKKSAEEFLDYFKKEVPADKIYISVCVDNQPALKMFENLGFQKIKEIEYIFNTKKFREMQMFKSFK